MQTYVGLYKDFELDKYIPFKDIRLSTRLNLVNPGY